MISDPRISEGITLLRTIFEDAKLTHEYDAPEDGDTLARATQKIELADALENITVKQKDLSNFSLVFAFKDLKGDHQIGEISVSEERVPNVATFGLLYRAIEYRRQSFGLN